MPRGTNVEYQSHAVLAFRMRFVYVYQINLTKKSGGKSGRKNLVFTYGSAWSTGAQRLASGPSSPLCGSNQAAAQRIVAEKMEAEAMLCAENRVLRQRLQMQKGRDQKALTSQIEEVGPLSELTDDVRDWECLRGPAPPDHKQ